jgi:hypothetical protein
VILKGALKLLKLLKSLKPLKKLKSAFEAPPLSSLIFVTSKKAVSL